MRAQQENIDKSFINSTSIILRFIHLFRHECLYTTVIDADPSLYGFLYTKPCAFCFIAISRIFQGFVTAHLHLTHWVWNLVEDVGLYT